MSTMPLQLHNCPVCGKYIWHGGYEDRGGQRWCVEHLPGERTRGRNA